MHPLFLLLIMTLVIAVGFGIWNFASVKRHQQTGGKASGIGGVADPLSGATDEKIRSGDEIRASLDDAAARRARPG